MINNLQPLSGAAFFIPGTRFGGSAGFELFRFNVRILFSRRIRCLVFNASREW